MNIQAVASCNCYFFQCCNQMAQKHLSSCIFSSSQLNALFRNGTITSCNKVFVNGETSALYYPMLKKINDGKSEGE